MKMSDKVVQKILDLLEEFPEIVIVFSKSGDCIYFDGTRFCLSFEEGGDRIHDCAERIDRKKALKILTSWARKEMLRIAIVYLTPPYENGVDWFT